jgi:menaquinone-dependent protoporphyrinogen oxidase
MAEPPALLVYATREGQTRKVALRIAEVLNSQGQSVTAVDAAQPQDLAGLDLQAFGLLIFGASMHAGGLERELVQFVRQHRAAIEQHRRSLFVVLLSAATRDPVLRQTALGDARAKVTKQLGGTFADIEFIAGALTYSTYPAPLKWLMSRVARSAGGDTDTSTDHEYTDWQQVERYAQRLADGLA